MRVHTFCHTANFKVNRHAFSESNTSTFILGPYLEREAKRKWQLHSQERVAVHLNTLKITVRYVLFHRSCANCIKAVKGSKLCKFLAISRCKQKPLKSKLCFVMDIGLEISYAQIHAKIPGTIWSK